MLDDPTVNVRYLVDDVAEAIDFYTTHLGFTVLTSALPAFADIARGNLRLLLSGPPELRRPPHGRRREARARWMEPHPLRHR